MLKLLIKKQLSEVFRSYFYNAKKNKARSKTGIVFMFIGFALLMVGVLGGMFTYLSVTLCKPLLDSGIGWLYFVILSGISIVLGAFGSVFNTFSSLYLAKDNDFLLSLPIPVKYIIVSRLMNVFLLGTMYSAVAILPAVIVYWVTAGLTVARVVCGLVLMLCIFLFVMILSCLLGWCVAKISRKFKNRSFVTVFASLLFIAAYYVVYYKASNILQDLIKNAVAYGTKIKADAPVLFRIGRVGEGDYVAAALCLAAVLVMLVLTWLVLKKTFLSIATAVGGETKKKYKEKIVGVRSPFRALLAREFSKFTASPTYMLNCGLGILLIPAAGVFLLIKGADIMALLQILFKEKPGTAYVIVCGILFLIASMNDMAAPSVSLEGKSIWIPQSLPVKAKTVLRAKTAMHLILSGIPVVFTTACALFVLKCPLTDKLLMALLVLCYIFFSALFPSWLGVKMANLTWTNDTVPIKQGGAVTIALFGGWGVAAAFAVPFFFIGYKLGVRVYLGIWIAVFAGVSVILQRWLDTKGAKHFAAL